MACIDSNRRLLSKTLTGVTSVLHICSWGHWSKSVKIIKLILRDCMVPIWWWLSQVMSAWEQNERGMEKSDKRGKRKDSKRVLSLHQRSRAIKGFAIKVLWRGRRSDRCHIWLLLWQWQAPLHEWSTLLGTWLCSSPYTALNSITVLIIYRSENTF